MKQLIKTVLNAVSLLFIYLFLVMRYMFLGVLVLFALGVTFFALGLITIFILKLFGYSI